MNSLMDNTARLLETASGCSDASLPASDWTLFIGPEGGIQMLAGADQSLESLAWTRGAQSAWQILNRETTVRVEGWQAGQRCILESPRSAGRAGRILGNLRLYELAA